MKSTKRALILSFCTIVLSAVLLVGTTFAWFTDAAVASVDELQTGTLTIQLEYATAWDGDGQPTAWADAKDATLRFRAADGSEDVLWEPGCTYRLPELRIRNGGSLALKYKVALSGIEGNAELNDVIDWTIQNNADAAATDLKTTQYHLTAMDGTHDADILRITGKMHDEVPARFQGQTISGIGITVVATQDTVESDSTGTAYDQNAVYPAIPVEIATLDELTAALKNANDGDLLKLTANIAGTSAFSVTKAVTIDLNGYSLTSSAAQTIKVSGELTIEDTSEAHSGKVANTYSGSADATTIDLTASDAKLTLLSGTVESNAKDDLYTLAIGSSKKKTCTVTISGGRVANPDGHVKSRAITASAGMTLQISGGEICGGLYGLDLYAGSTTLLTGGSVTANASVNRSDEYGKQYAVHMKGTAVLTVGARDASSTPVVQGIKLESSGVKTELPQIDLVKGEITSPIYSLEQKYNYSLFKLGIEAGAPVTFADDTARFFLPDGLTMVSDGGVWRVAAQ